MIVVRVTKGLWELFALAYGRDLCQRTHYRHVRSVLDHTHQLLAGYTHPFYLDIKATGIDIHDQELPGTVCLRTAVEVYHYLQSYLNMMEGQ